MKYPKILERSSVLLAMAATVCFSAYSQEETFELSPFVISSSDESGYRATSTLAGSRLNTPLRDVAASVTVLTGQFLDDLGATDIENAMAYIAGVETAISTDTAERSSNGYLEDGANTQPGSNRVRGLSQADVTQDFFQVGNGNLDRYNIERITLVRGPNSVLFGLGSPAGIIDYTTKKATVGADLGELSLKIDSFGSVRGTFDYNRVLSENFAVRFMGLKENGKSQYSSSFDKDTRFSGSILFKPFEKTSLRFGFEVTKNDARRPNYSLPVDNITGWIQNGRPTWDPLAHVGQATNDVYPDEGPVNNRGLEPFFSFSTNLMIFDDPNSATPVRIAKSGAGFRTGEEVNVIAPDTGIVLARSRNILDDVDNFIDLSVSDERVFPIFDIDLGSLPGNSQYREDQKYNITLSQKVTQDLHFELAAYKDRMQNENISLFTGGDRWISIDVNETMLDGSPNPNFLRPYIAGRGTGSENASESESRRLSAAYEFDFADKTDRFAFLGRHVFSGVLSDRTLTNYSAGFNPASAITDDADTFGVNKTIYGHWLYQVRYVGDPFTPDMDYPNYAAFPSTAPVPGADTYIADRPINGALPEDPISWGQSDPFTTGSIYSRGSWSQGTIQGQGLTWQSHFWDGRIAGVLGWRSDDVGSDGNNAPIDPVTSEILVADRHLWGPSAEVGPEETGSTSTRGIVFHAFPWLSLHFNESDNFQVSEKKVYATLDEIPTSSGQGQDIGVVFRTKDRKIEAKLNYFETSQKNVSGRGTLASAARFGVNGYERFVWATLRNFTNNTVNRGTFDNGGTYDFRGEQLDEAAFRETFAHRHYDAESPDKLGPPTTARYFAPFNSDDTVDVDASGYELELTFNPTESWRIAFNATKSQTIQDNIGPGTAAYVAARIPHWSLLWGDLVTDADGNIIDATGGVRFQDNPNQKLMYQEYLNRIVATSNTNKLAEGRTNVGQAEYAANLVTNYSFNNGKWRGLSVGANVRWREGSTVGYPIFDTGVGLASDLDNPFITDSSLNVGINASYRRKINNDKITWITQFHVNNLVGDDDLMVSAINPDGSVAAYRPGREMYMQLTNTFRF